MNIAKRNQKVNKSKKKNYKIVNFFYFEMQQRPHFKRNGLKFVAISNQEICKAVGCTPGLVSQVMNQLYDEGYIVYKYINSDGDRKHIHERKRIALTAKGEKFFRKEFEKSNDDNDSGINENKKLKYRVKNQINNNNNYIYKSSSEGIFKKNNDSLVAKVWYELKQYGYNNIKITKARCKYIHAGVNLLSPHGDSLEKFSCCRNYIRTVLEKYGKMSIHRLFNFKLIRKFLHDLHQEINQAVIQWQTLKRSDYREVLSNNFENFCYETSSQIGTPRSIQSVTDMLLEKLDKFKLRL